MTCFCYNPIYSGLSSKISSGYGPDNAKTPPKGQLKFNFRRVANDIIAPYENPPNIILFGFLS